MANFTERIKIVIDVVGDKATAQVKGFRQAVAEAETTTGKFKAGLKSVGQSLTSFLSSPSAMAGAATAAAAAVGKLVSKAMDLSLAVGDLAAKTGMTAEESSRWLEVTADLGIESDALAGALKKMSVAVDPKKFAELGVEIARTSTGATDVSATLLNVIDRLHGIQDPAERARVATQLLGKNWQSMAELIQMGSGQVKAALDDVYGAKIVNEAEVAAARELRDNLDSVRDSGEEAALVLGRQLLPMVSEQLSNLATVLRPVTDQTGLFGKVATEAFKGMASGLGPFQTTIDMLRDGRDMFSEPIDDKWSKWANATFDGFVRTKRAAEMGIKTWRQYYDALKSGALSEQDAANAVNEYSSSQADMYSMYGEYTRSLIDYRNEVNGTAISEADAAATKDALARSAQAAATAIDLQRTANDKLIGGLNDNLSEIDLRLFFDDLPGQLAELKANLDGGKIDAERWKLEQERAIESAKAKLADYLINVKGLDADYVTTLLVDVKGAEGDIDRILGKVAKFDKDKKVFLERNGVSMKATGGYAAGVTLVGEQGPELVDLPGGSTVYNRVATSRLLGNINQPASVAAVSTVTVNVLSADPQAVVGAIKKYTARGGQV